MCQRHHHPEPFTIGGMPVVICDDITQGGYQLPKGVVVGGGPHGGEGIEITAGQGGMGWKSL